MRNLFKNVLTDLAERLTVRQEDHDSLQEDRHSIDRVRRSTISSARWVTSGGLLVEISQAKIVNENSDIQEEFFLRSWVKGPDHWKTTDDELVVLRSSGDVVAKGGERWAFADLPIVVRYQIHYWWVNPDIVGWRSR